MFKFNKTWECRTFYSRESEWNGRGGRHTGYRCWGDTELTVKGVGIMIMVLECCMHETLLPIVFKIMVTIL